MTQYKTHITSAQLLEAWLILESNLLVHDNENLSLSGATYRVAEGGYEYVDIVKVDNIDKIFTS